MALRRISRGVPAIVNGVPTANNGNADFVLGRPNLTTVTPGVDDDKMTGPQTVAAADGKLFAVEYDNNRVLRVLVWNRFPAGNFAPADVVLGRRDVTGDAANDDNGDGLPDATPSARTLAGPDGLHVSGTRLFVADSENSRWLVFDAR